MKEYFGEKIKELMVYLGIDPIYGLSLLAIVSFLIIFRKKWYVLSKKGTSQFEKVYKFYFIIQVCGVILFFILCIMHFLKMF
jgi:hypothetical protein